MEQAGHFDIPRIRKGHLGGLFWSWYVSPRYVRPFPRANTFIVSYVDCKPSGDDFLTPTNRVRDTLEQIDIAKLMIERYGDVFEFVTTAQGVRDAVRAGKVASLLGVEGCVLGGGFAPRPDLNPDSALWRL